MLHSVASMVGMWFITDTNEQLEGKILIQQFVFRPTLVCWLKWLHLLYMDCTFTDITQRMWHWQLLGSQRSRQSSQGNKLLMLSILRGFTSYSNCQLCCIDLEIHSAFTLYWFVFFSECCDHCCSHRDIQPVHALSKCNFRPTL